jgi:hypothetical protein
MDKLKPVFPFAEKHRLASEPHAALDLAYIDAEDDWEKIAQGKLPNPQITSRRTKLLKLKRNAEHRYFPEGIQFSSTILNMADRSNIDYFKTTFNQDVAS